MMKRDHENMNVVIATKDKRAIKLRGAKSGLGMSEEVRRAIRDRLERPIHVKGETY